MEDEIILSPRKKTILFCAIDNYIKLASPITSLLVQQTELTDISTATIRNELNALEAMGFLKQFGDFFLIFITISPFSSVLYIFVPYVF